MKKVKMNETTVKALCAKMLNRAEFGEAAIEDVLYNWEYMTFYAMGDKILVYAMDEIENDVALIYTV